MNSSQSHIVAFFFLFDERRLYWLLNLPALVSRLSYRRYYWWTDAREEVYLGTYYDEYSFCVPRGATECQRCDVRVIQRDQDPENECPAMVCEV